MFNIYNRYIRYSRHFPLDRMERWPSYHHALGNMEKWPSHHYPPLDIWRGGYLITIHIYWIPQPVPPVSPVP